MRLLRVMQELQIGGTGSGGSVRLHFEARNYLLSYQVDRSQDLIMRRVSGLQHEDHLIEAGFRPLFDLAADRVGISAERHSVG
jgi:hypothetical protein